MRSIRRQTMSLCAAIGIQPLLPMMCAQPAEAAAKPAAYAVCMTRANSTRDMQACQQAGLKDADARLAAAYANALAALPADQQMKLREAQRRWSAFRTSDCAVFYGSQSGSIATVRGGDCMIDRTIDRIKNLRGFSQK